MNKWKVSLISIVLLLSLVACSFATTNEENEETNASHDTTTNNINEEANSELSGDSMGDPMPDIPLRDHDFPEPDEVIDDLEESETIYSKEGENLVLPDQFPSDFPIAEGMSASFIVIGQPGSLIGDKLEVWFTDEGHYSLDELNALYSNYIQSGFTDTKVDDMSQYMTDLTVYEGMKGDEQYVVGINPEDGYNVITLTINRD